MCCPRMHTQRGRRHALLLAPASCAACVSPLVRSVRSVSLNQALVPFVSSLQFVRILRQYPLGRLVVFAYVIGMHCFIYFLLHRQVEKALLYCGRAFECHASFMCMCGVTAMHCASPVVRWGG